MTTYYVSNAGNNTSGNGSERKPYATLAKVLSVAPAGSTIILRRGDYTGGLFIRTASLTFRSYAGERARIVLPTTDTSLNKRVVLYFLATGGRVLDLDIEGGSVYNLQFDKGSALVENCRLQNGGYLGVKICPGADDVTIRGCEVTGAGSYNKTTAGTGLAIDNVNGDRMLVENCHIHDNLGYGVQAKGGAIGCIIRNNVIERCQGGIFLGQFTGQDFFDTTQNPECYENRGGIAHNNLIVDTTYAGIALYSTLACQVYRNTLMRVAQEAMEGLMLSVTIDYRYPATDPRYWKRNVSAVLLDNIIRVTSPRACVCFREKAYDTAKPPDIRANYIYHPEPIFNGLGPAWDLTGGRFYWPQWSARWPDAATVGDPGLTDDYRLLETSPCRGAGVPVPGEAMDPPTPSDIGAYPYSGH